VQYEKNFGFSFDSISFLTQNKENVTQLLSNCFEKEIVVNFNKQNNQVNIFQKFFNYKSYKRRLVISMSSLSKFIDIYILTKLIISFFPES
jgi:hypothetical protein